MCPCQLFTSVRKEAAGAASWYKFENYFCIDMSRWCSLPLPLPHLGSVSEARTLNAIPQECSRVGQDSQQGFLAPSPSPLGRGTWRHQEGPIWVKGGEKTSPGRCVDQQSGFFSSSSPAGPWKSFKEWKELFSPLSFIEGPWILKLTSHIQETLYSGCLWRSISHVICAIDSKGMWPVTVLTFLRDDSGEREEGGWKPPKSRRGDAGGVHGSMSCGNEHSLRPGGPGASFATPMIFVNDSESSSGTAWGLTVFE